MKREGMRDRGMKRKKRPNHELAIIDNIIYMFHFMFVLLRYEMCTTKFPDHMCTNTIPHKVYFHMVLAIYIVTYVQLM